MGTRVLYALPALLLAALALILAVVGLSRDPEPAPVPVTVQQGDQARTKAAAHRYWVVTRGVPAGEPLTQDMLAEVTSESPLPDGMSAEQSLVGQALVQDVRAGELLTKRHLEGGGRPLPDAVPEGFRAIALPVDNVVGAGGLLQPGDRVDVISAFTRTEGKKGPAAMVVQKDLEVLAVHGNLAGSVPADDEDRRRNANNTVVLAVPEEKIPSLLLASTQSTLRLSVHGSGVRVIEESEVAEESETPTEEGQVLAEAAEPAKPFYLEDFFPKEEKPVSAPVVRRSPGHRVQVFEGSEARSTYVR
ncbi:Flp pilus assembly protein CpaB [Alloalcanivorax xenomutans]|uniref:Flp pilus assembly protein CpaB n=1 Tax=Alloalcanivorax xenomutans TaxID=1094342 RepID=UPI003A7FEE71